MTQHRVKLFKIANAYSYAEYGSYELVASWVADCYSNWYPCNEDEYQKILKAVEYKNNLERQKSKYREQIEQLVLIDDCIDNEKTIENLLFAYDALQKEEQQKEQERHKKLEKLKEKVNEKKKLRELKKLKELEEKYKNSI